MRGRRHALGRIALLALGIGPCQCLVNFPHASSPRGCRRAAHSRGRPRGPPRRCPGPATAGSIESTTTPGESIGGIRRSCRPVARIGAGPIERLIWRGRFGDRTGQDPSWTARPAQRAGSEKRHQGQEGTARRCGPRGEAAVSDATGDGRRASPVPDNSRPGTPGSAAAFTSGTSIKRRERTRNRAIGP